MINRRKRLLFGIVLSACVSLFVLIVGECLARMFEVREREEGPFRHVPNELLGWVPRSNSWGRAVSREFDARYRINALGMNDDPVRLGRTNRHGILVVGDSHTFALGVNMEDAWPNVLETMLTETNGEAFVVNNGGVIGYSLGQYFTRLRQLDQLLPAEVLIIGFSAATDLYDLVPPERGGFVYGGDAARIYYTLNDDGLLEERSWPPVSAGVELVSTGGDVAGNGLQRSRSLELRRWLEGNLSLYRCLKRSSFALWLGTRLRPAGESLWPGLDTALKIELNESDTFRWSLAEELLAAMADYAETAGVPLYLVNIPYLAQVYDPIWKSSFGGMPERYDRGIAATRLSGICGRHGIRFVDLTEVMIRSVRENGLGLHFPRDGHPNPAGHRVIAAVVRDRLIHDAVLEPRVDGH